MKKIIFNLPLAGAASAAADQVRGFNADQKALRELVWEPVHSPRLSAYRKATCLGDGN